jgi:hypothetical protein
LRSTITAFTAVDHGLHCRARMELAWRTYTTAMSKSNRRGAAG